MVSQFGSFSQIHLGSVQPLLPGHSSWETEELLLMLPCLPSVDSLATGVKKPDLEGPSGLWCHQHSLLSVNSHGLVLEGLSLLIGESN